MDFVFFFLKTESHLPSTIAFTQDGCQLNANGFVHRDCKSNDGCTISLSSLTGGERAYMSISNSPPLVCFLCICMGAHMYVSFFVVVVVFLL